MEITPGTDFRAYTLTSCLSDEISGADDHVRRLSVATPPLPKAA
jgi:hypothetical protein